LSRIKGIGDDPLWLALGREQRRHQPHREFAGLESLIALLVLVDHVVDALGARATGLAEGDRDAGHILHLDGDVLEHVAEPGALAFAHPADEATGLAVGAAMLGEPRQGRDQRVDPAVAEFRGRPVLQFAEVEFQPDHREMRVQRRPDEHTAVKDAHAATPG
jgi:hypothetical protein